MSCRNKIHFGCECSIPYNIGIRVLAEVPKKTA